MKGTAIEVQRVLVGAELVLAQAAWDQFLQDTLATIKCPNPDQRRDIALDRTIRALGQRPRAPLSEQQRADLQLRHEVSAIIRESSRIRRYGQDTPAQREKAAKFGRLLCEE